MEQMPFIANATATLALLSSLATPTMAHAAVFKDAQLESLQDAGKYVELEQLAQARSSLALMAEPSTHSSILP